MTFAENRDLILFKGCIMTESLKYKSENKTIFICWLAYTCAYIGRLNFSASIVSVVSSLEVTKAEAGLVSSFFFFAYGIGQLVNGVLSKRYNAKFMIFASLAVSSVLNFLMPFSGDISVMKYIWLLNGAVQSILWCTLIKTLSEKVSDKKMPKAIVAMSTTVPVGTFIAYGLSALFVKLADWRFVFYFASVILLASAFVWLSMYGKNDKTVLPVTVKEKSAASKGKIIIFALIITALAGVANGFVKDGVTTWVSSLLYEEFDVSQSFSIMLTLLLPLVATFSAAVVKKLHEKIKSHTVLNTLFFLASTVLCVGIILSLKLHSFVAIMVCFMGIASLMAMVNNVITSIFPLDNRKLLDAGFTAGFLNTFCYVGSTVTSYSLGSVAQTKGWNVTFIVMLLVCAAAAIISLIGCVCEKVQAKADR